MTNKNEEEIIEKVLKKYEKEKIEASIKETPNCYGWCFTYGEVKENILPYALSLQRQENKDNHKCNIQKEVEILRNMNKREREDRNLWFEAGQKQLLSSLQEKIEDYRAILQLANPEDREYLLNKFDEIFKEIGQ